MVQVFFAISGFVNAVVLYRRISEVKMKYSTIWIFSIVGRLIRFVPVMMFLALFHATWLYRIGSGPFWDKIVFAARQGCRSVMWRNFLLINNYPSNNHHCLAHTWFLAADFHLSIIGTGLLLFVLRLVGKSFY